MRGLGIILTVAMGWHCRAFYFFVRRVRGRHHDVMRRKPQRSLLVLWILVTSLHSLFGQEAAEETKSKIEARSPDGQFAFRYSGQSEQEKQTYDLINTRSGKTVITVAESDPDFGPSARFVMKVLWRSDSKAFALTATLQKRGSEVSVYLRDGSTFNAIELPELTVDIPEKLEQGKTTNSDSQEAKRWQKDGSLIVEIATVSSGNNGTTTATRTVVLGFDQSDEAKIRKSSIKIKVEK